MLNSAIRPIDQALLRRELCAAYAGGALEPAMQLLVETQMLLSPAAAVEALEAEAVSGAMFDAEAPAAVAEDALSGVWARIGGEAPSAPNAHELPEAARRAGAMIDEVLALPQPMQDLALNAIGQGGWSFAGPGLRTLALDVGGRARAELLRIEPGWGSPHHDHEDGEFTLVLCGAFRDDFGAYRAGDIAYAYPGMRHRPVAMPGEICYAFAVSEGAPRFTGALGLLRRFLPH